MDTYVVSRVLEVTKEPERAGQVKPIVLRRGEAGMVIEGIIQLAKQPFDVTGATAYFCAYNANHDIVKRPATVEGNKARWRVTTDLTVTSGAVEICYFEFQNKDGEPLTSDSMPLIIRDNMDLKGIDALAYKNVVDELCAELTEQRKRVEFEEANRRANEDVRVAAEKVRDQAETARIEAEDIRRAAENARNAAEIARTKAESLRRSEELSRRSAEANRKQSEETRVANENERKAAEAARSADETARNNAETERAESETARKAAEDTRAEKEQARQSNETARNEAEGKRATAEELRASAEIERDNRETVRNRAEDQRKANEIERQKAEAQRRSNMTRVMESETERIAAEAERERQQQKNNADQAANNLAAQGRLTRILKPGEFDPETREPTIEGDLTHVFAVPTEEAEAAKAALDEAQKAIDNAIAADAGGQGPEFDGMIEQAQSDLEAAQEAYEAANRYVEWLWIIDEDTGVGYWELYGSGNSTLPDPVTTTEIDRMWAGETVESKHVVYSSGEAYNVSVAKAEIAKSVADADKALRSWVTDEAKAHEAANADVAAKLGTVTVGAAGKPVYLNDGVPTEIEKVDEAVTAEKIGDATVGSESQPVYIKEGKPTAASLPLASVDGPGYLPQLTGNKDDILDGQGNFRTVKIESEPRLPDRRPLKSAIADATKIHDGAFTDSAGEHDIGTWHSTPEAIAALQSAIDAAQSTVDAFGDSVLAQSQLDEAQAILEAAVVEFKSKSTEVIADLSEYESLTARVVKVEESAEVSPDGKDVQFGSKYVLQSEKAAVDKAIDTCDKAIAAASRQSAIDAACDTLETAVTLYEGQVKTATASYTAIDAAIKAAQDASKDVSVSADGSDLPAGSKYVTEQQTLDDITDAISKAQTARNEATTQGVIDKATADLTTATATFNEKVQQNLKIPQTSEELEAMSWEEIAQLSAAAAQDPTDFLFMTDSSHKLEKTVTMSGISGVTDVKARIIGIGQDVDAQGNKIGITFQLCDGLSYNQPVNMRMNASNTTNGGWQSSEMRSTNLPKIEAALPSDLKSRLKTMKKKTNMAASGSTITETEDKLALLSCVEVFGGDQNNYGSNKSGYQTWYPNEGEWYQWYKNHNTDNDRIIKRADGSAYHWWLRSIQSSTSFARVNGAGIFDWNRANNTNLPCACFAV